MRKEEIDLILDSSNLDDDMAMWLRSVASVQRGWLHGRSGEEVAKVALCITVSFIERWSELHSDAPVVIFPLENGGVLVEWFHPSKGGTISWSLEMRNDKTVFLFIICNGQSIGLSRAYDSDSISEVVEEIITTIEASWVAGGNNQR